MWMGKRESEREKSQDVGSIRGVCVVQMNECINGYGLLGGMCEGLIKLIDLID